MSKKSIKEYIAEKRRSYAASSKERKHRALDEIKGDVVATLKAVCNRGKR